MRHGHTCGRSDSCQRCVRNVIVWCTCLYISTELLWASRATSRESPVTSTQPDHLSTLTCLCNFLIALIGMKKTSVSWNKCFCLFIIFFFRLMIQSACASTLGSENLSAMSACLSVCLSCPSTLTFFVCFFSSLSSLLFLSPSYYPSLYWFYLTFFLCKLLVDLF